MDSPGRREAVMTQEQHAAWKNMCAEFLRACRIVAATEAMSISVDGHDPDLKRALNDNTRACAELGRKLMNSYDAHFGPVEEEEPTFRIPVPKALA
jgi:hypothetical protein